MGVGVCITQLSQVCQRTAVDESAEREQVYIYIYAYLFELFLYFLKSSLSIKAIRAYGTHTLPSHPLPSLTPSLEQQCLPVGGRPPSFGLGGAGRQGSGRGYDLHGCPGRVHWLLREGVIVARDDDGFCGTSFVGEGLGTVARSTDVLNL